jgi:hypothetical protein
VPSLTPSLNPATHSDDERMQLAGRLALAASGRLQTRASMRRQPSVMDVADGPNPSFAIVTEAPWHSYK